MIWSASFRRAAALVAAAALGAAGVHAQTIEITSVPAYGAPGELRGRVTGVDTRTHRVAIYIQIEGSGWWSKPTAQQPAVGILSDGTFRANVVGGGLDDRATIFCAALLGPGAAAPVAQGAGRVPASLAPVATAYRERFARTVSFAGRTWAVKESPWGVGPGDNAFSAHPGDVFVDSQGRLHLNVRFRDGRWRCAEVFTTEDMGYGTYWFTTETEVEDLDDRLTFGAFTWDAHGDDTTIPSWPYREIDFEDARWGDPNEPTTSQVVVQPWEPQGNLRRFTIPDLSADPTLTRIFTWTPNQVEFIAARGVHAPCIVPAAATIHRSTYTHAPAIGRFVPPEGRARFRFNLWINGGGAPRNGRTAEVIVSDFRYSPVPGTLVGGCDVNPRQSLVAVSGSTSIGTGLVLGLDNPAGTQPVGTPAALLLGFAPDQDFPCGTLLPGFGLVGPDGELQVDPGAGLLTYASGLTWGGPGQRAEVTLPIPRDFLLVGRRLHALGVFVDPTPGAAVPVGLTDAIEICVRR